MGSWQVGFEYPAFLGLLALVPLVWWTARHSLAGLGRWRQFFAVFFRSVVLLLLIAALSGIQWVWISDRLSVLYVLDQSDSIAPPQKQLMLRYATENAARHRRTESNQNDRVGLVTFGREAVIESPPSDESLPKIQKLESQLGPTDATNIESALKLAQASFPENSASRVVIVTDGNETVGNATNAAKMLVDSGIGIDIVPIDIEKDAEVLIDKIDIPGNVRQGQPVDARVVLHRYTELSDKSIDGRLRVTRSLGNQTEVIADGPVTLDQEVNVFPIPHRIDEAGGYTYDAEFVPDNPESDSNLKNNRATAFTYARGKGRVLMIENADRVGEYQPLVDALRREGIDVETRDTSRIFSSLIELQSYDCVVLAGVSRTVGEGDASFTAFSDSQMEMLTTSIQQFGTGVLMIGGPEAFGAGGWSNSKLEEAMPVDFQVKNSKVTAVGALALVIDKSGSMEGEKIQAAKSAARAALDALGPLDYVGFYAFDDGLSTMTPLGKNTDIGRIMKMRIRSLGAGGGTNMEPAVERAYRDLEASPASVKHVIILTDGMTAGSSYSTMARAMAAKGITTSTVAIGQGANQPLLQGMASNGGGQFYSVSNVTVLPKIFMREARRVTRPLIFEPEGGVQPKLMIQHEALTGLAKDYPPLNGFVLTQVKENPLVEVPLISPEPSEAVNASILAMWTYGLGRTAVFTSDVGQRWASDWPKWSQYDQFFTQLVRWTMRPSLEEGNFQLATQIRDGKVHVVVTAMDAKGRLANFMEMSGVAVDPELKAISFDLKQEAPGRYTGKFDIGASGAYILNIVPALGLAPIISGVNLPFSEEYRVLRTNRHLLENMSSMVPAGGSPGELLEPLTSESLGTLVSQNSFRHNLRKARSQEDAWPLAVFVCAVIFFADVFVRRVAIDLTAPLKWMHTKLVRAETEVDNQRRTSLERLSTGKAKLAAELDRQRSAVPMTDQTFISASQVSVDVENFGSTIAKENLPAASREKFSTGDNPEEPSYTTRLLEAKRKAIKKKD